MDLCHTCGNEIPDDVVICPFCESRQTAVPSGHEPDTSEETGMSRGPGKKPLEKKQMSGKQRMAGNKHMSGKQQLPGKEHKAGKKHDPGRGYDSIHRKTADVNLKAGKPVVDEAFARLKIKISEARLNGIGLIRIIHGWGSSGEGGRIKEALPAHLDGLKRRRVIRNYIPGEQYSNTMPQGRHLLSRYPELKTTIRSDRRNPGITFIEL